MDGGRTDAGRYRSLSGCVFAMSGREIWVYSTEETKEGRRECVKEGYVENEHTESQEPSMEENKGYTRTMPFTILNGHYANHPLTSSIGRRTGSPSKLKAAVPVSRKG